MDEQTPQSHNARNIIIAVVVLAVGIGILSILPKQTAAPTNNNPVVVDYNSCVTAGYPIAQTNPTTCTTPDGRTFSNTEVVTEPDVVIDTPQIAQIVTSPMTIKGKVKNSWFFEANLPIELRDENGKVLAQKGYMTPDDWMTPGYKTLDTTLSFKAPTTDYGVLVIHNDNPSGLPENDKKFEVPIRFK
jgi:hypothetical protein